MNSVGEQIKNLRVAKKMSQADFAERIGITGSAVSSYENGMRLPSYDVLIKMARLFKVSTDFLLGYTDKTVLDVTGLTRKQINEIQNIVITYQRHNILYKQSFDDDSIHEDLVKAGMIDEETEGWFK